MNANEYIHITSAHKLFSTKNSTRNINYINSRVIIDYQIIILI